MELRNKNVIVTGGARGIGRQLAVRLAAGGSLVWVLDQDADGLLQLEQEVTNVKGRVCDLTRAEEVEKAVADVFAVAGRIDVLVNNAGAIHNALLVGISPTGLQAHGIAEWDKMLAVNLSSVFYVTVAVVQRMVGKRTKGVIVNVSSVAAAGNVGQCAYSAAKAGVHALTVTWARELSLWGIRVAGVAPGFTRTSAMEKSMSPALITDWEKKTPLRRMAAPQEIVDGIMFVLSNDFFCGRELELDGGLRI